MAEHLDQQLSCESGPAAVEIEACLQGCTEELSALGRSVDAAKVLSQFQAFGESIDLRLVDQKIVSDLEEGNQDRLRASIECLEAQDIITRFKFDIESLPDSLIPLFQPLVEAGIDDEELKDILVYVTNKEGTDFAGTFQPYEEGSPGRGLVTYVEPAEADNREGTEPELMVSEMFVDDNGIIILSAKHIVDGEKDRFMSVLVNETSHHLLNAARNTYINRRAQSYVGKPFAEVPTTQDFETDLVDGFRHPDLPSGDYSYDYFNEFISDTASLMTNDAAVGELLWRVSDIGDQHTYGLSRDFYFHQLSVFLAETKGVEVTPEQLAIKLDTALVLRKDKQKTEIPESYVEIENQQFSILDEYALDNADFLVYWRDKVTSVGTAFTQHVADKIKVLPASDN